MNKACLSCELFLITFVDHVYQRMCCHDEGRVQKWQPVKGLYGSKNAGVFLIAVSIRISLMRVAAKKEVTEPRFFLVMMLRSSLGMTWLAATKYLSQIIMASLCSS